MHEAEEKLAKNVKSSAAPSRAWTFVGLIIVPLVNLNPGGEGCSLGWSGVLVPGIDRKSRGECHGAEEGWVSCGLEGPGIECASGTHTGDKEKSISRWVGGGTRL